MTCPKCRRALAPLDMFCGFCGARAVAERLPATAVPERPPAAATPVAEPDERTGVAPSTIESTGVELSGFDLPGIERPGVEAPGSEPPPAAAPAVAIASSPEAASATRVEPAGFWIRAGAFAVDAAILAAWMGVIWGAVMGAAVASALGGDDPAMLLAAMERSEELAPSIAALFAGVLLAYLVAFVVVEGATPGKMLFRLHVLGADGPRVGMGRAFAREGLGRLAVVLTLGVGFVPVAFSASRRGLHDLIARTRVVRLPEERPAQG